LARFGIAGVVMGISNRVLGESGDYPNRYTDARSRRNYAGTSPETIASGRKRAVLDTSKVTTTANTPSLKASTRPVSVNGIDGRSLERRLLSSRFDVALLCGSPRFRRCIRPACLGARVGVPSRRPSVGARRDDRHPKKMSFLESFQKSEALICV
jgi:hypothetical protein